MLINQGHQINRSSRVFLSASEVINYRTTQRSLQSSQWPCNFSYWNYFVPFFLHFLLAFVWECKLHRQIMWQNSDIYTIVGNTLKSTFPRNFFTSTNFLLWIFLLELFSQRVFLQLASWICTLKASILQPAVSFGFPTGRYFIFSCVFPWFPAGRYSNTSNVFPQFSASHCQTDGMFSHLHNKS